MNWFAVAWLGIASACLTLAAVHLLVWLRQHDALANASFAALAVSVAALGYIEFHMARADALSEFGRLLWWYQFPIWSGVLAIVAFVRLYFRAGRAWLGWVVVALRTLALVVNFFSSPSINYREVLSLEKIEIFGEAFTVVHGVPNPWQVLAQLSLVTLVIFIADATRAIWRRGDRRRAVTIGGSLVLFIAAGTVIAMFSFWQLARLPLIATVFFAPIVVAMGFELSLDLVRAVRLSAELDAKTVELKRSEQRLAFAAEAAGAGLWSVEAGTGRLWATPHALSMFGLPPGRSHHINEVLHTIHPDDRVRVGDLIRGAADWNPGIAIEYRVLAPDGDVRWYTAHGGAHQIGSPASSMMMGVTMDITERKRVEDETARQQVELEHLARVATVTELSGALAHELNQPLAIIMSNAEAAQQLMETSEPDLQEVRSILHDIVAADERAGEVIKRLRAMLKRDAPKREPLAMNELVRESLHFMRTDLLRRGVAVDMSLGENLQKVFADRVQIEQVLINVVTNACDAMAGNAPGDRVLGIVTSSGDDVVCVRVADVGSGLPASPDLVFDRFYTTKKDGLGMGLAISRSIIAGHGGRLSAEANGERGAAFTICLPLAGEGVA